MLLGTGSAMTPLCLWKASILIEALAFGISLYMRTTFCSFPQTLFFFFLGNDNYCMNFLHYLGTHPGLAWTWGPMKVLLKVRFFPQGISSDIVDLFQCHVSNHFFSIYHVSDCDLVSWYIWRCNERITDNKTSTKQTLETFFHF